MRLESCRLDAREFRRQADAARQLAAAGQTAEAVPALRAALGLWRGPVLEGIGGLAIEAAAARLDEQRLAAWEDCLDLELRLGRHREITGELQALVDESPLRERLVEGVRRGA